MSFFRDLKTRFGAPGDFAQAYVIAHEIGHHVQTILGISERVRQAQSRARQSQTNAIQVRMELQADCFAGVWAHHANNARNILEAGDVEEALGAANAIGDDRLQRRSQGRVVPDSFTHGSSEQRMRWFR
ncbi:MAG: neutral zinc metallopeptidase, partial [Fimbriimonadaceae bacterium]|nr:neutral zinc metallopeptidase [Alphaproteobacteria bacterium]